jgi:4-hydroxy-tetrahydrodipicolinate reductase
MGCAILRLVLRKPGLALAGAFARRSARAGLDVGALLGLGPPVGVAVESDLGALLARSRPDVAIQATCSRLADAEAEIAACLERGVHVVSIAEEVAWPAARSPAWAARMDRLARARGVALLGTGVNPGFVLDLLVVTLTGVCSDVESIRARRVNDLSPYGPSVLRSQGVGLTAEAFERGLADGSVVGHVGFSESIHMIAAALGWELERVEESREPILARRLRETPDVRVEPGRVAGCLHVARGFVAGRCAIELQHPQQVRPEAEGVATGDSIEIVGTPSLRLAGSPEIPGGEATAALAVNAIPRVLRAPPGLRTMTDLPPPAALLGDARRALEARVG